jgi:hypothetical protein
MSQRKPPDDDPARAGQGWGKTRPLDSDALGSALPTPLRPEPADKFVRQETSEPSVRIARNVITGGNPAATGDQAPRPAPRPQASPRPPQPVQSAKATLLMTDADPATRQASGRAPVRAEDRRAVSGDRQPNPDFAQPYAEMPAQPRAQAQPPAKAAAPAAAGGRPASPKPARPPESTRPVPAQGSESEPLRLQLHEGDMLEQPVDIGPDPSGVPTRSSGLVVGVVVVLVIAAGAGVWYGMSSHGKPAEPPPTQNEAQLAPTGTAQPTSPAAASPVPAQAPAQAAVPTAPAQAAQQPPTAVPSAVPAQAPAERAPAAQPAAEPHAAEPSAASAPSKGAARKPKRRGGGASGASVPGEASDDVAAAREALRSLESGPVIKLKPREEEPPSDDGTALAPPEPPEPPPPAPE